MKKFPLVMPLITFVFAVVVLLVSIFQIESPSQIPLLNSKAVQQLHINKEGKLNINLATASEFEQLSGIGPTLAERLILYRAEHGPFSATDEIMNVQGIGPEKYNAIKNHICVGP